MNDYLEKEYKVLEVDPKELGKKLEEMGAKKVFDGPRVFTTFDYSDLNLSKEGKEVRLTKEEKLKLTYSAKLDADSKETIKLFVSRKKEAVDFLNRLSLNPIAECKSHRVSYEWKGIDFDLDSFPEIPSFLRF